MKKVHAFLVSLKEKWGEVLIFNGAKFEKLLPGTFRDLKKHLEGRGYTLTLVGGTVRDYLRCSVLGQDWDIELTHRSEAFSKDSWKELGKSLNSFGRCTFLPYEILRLEVQGYQFEFSPPRREHYSESLQDRGHKNFEAELSFEIPFEEAVQRRDFTINALGIRFHGEHPCQLLDPLNGKEHLQEKVLYPAGADFGKDPVRFLRSIRFSLLLGFSLSSELEAILARMDLTGISPSYLWSEMQRSQQPLRFLQELVQRGGQHPELKLPLGAEILPVIPTLTKLLSTPQKQEAWMIALEWAGIDSRPWQNYFRLSAETSKRFSAWAQNSKVFQQIFPEKFHGEFPEILLLPEFEQLFSWYFGTRQILQKYPPIDLMAMIDEYLPQWHHLFVFEPVKDVKHIEPPLRAKYQVWNLCQRL